MNMRVTLENIILETAAAARPPEQLTVSQAAEKYRYLNNPGAYVGPYKNDITPYLVEPQDTLQSIHHTGMIFVGPAQTGKTEMFLDWVAYSAKCDPADMMLVQTTMNTARDFSMRRIDRMHRHSTEIGALLTTGKHSDNTFDKHYTSGMMLSLGWPAISELSGKPIPRMFLTDYDRMEQNVDGEGNPFDLSKKRITTFKRYGMCAAESSPGFQVEDPKWVKTSPHEAPPTTGILALYNRGDKRRWMWDCVSCHGKFEPDFNLIKWPEGVDKTVAAKQCWLECPHCELRYYHDPRDGLPGKYEMNLKGRWIKEGETWQRSGEITGEAVHSDIASFWMKRVAAAFATWETLVFNYLAALEEYLKTGSEESLKTTTNTDQGNPYVPKSLSNDRLPETIKARAKPLAMKAVPEGVRFMIATCDVQKNRFVVQVHGIKENGDRVVIDRFEIRKSKRKDGEGERFWVNPGAYLEDWKLLVEEVMEKTYPLSDGSGRQMAIKLTMCDSGGKAGVTENAYQFYRWLRHGPKDEEFKDEKEEGDYLWHPGLAGRFLLLKGGSSPSAPRVQLSHPDSQRKDRHAGARGEIPVLMINTNMLKDQVDKRLDRTDPGGQYVFPDWLDNNFFIELTVEVKDAKKGWLNPKNYRNESWDLLTYLEAALLSPVINMDYLDFTAPPGWAATWNQNDLVFLPTKETPRPFDAKPKSSYDLSKLAEALA